jgi:predicted enzyme related to lactoylglutathione lyase
VDGICQTMAQVVSAGGEFLREPVGIPGVGHCVSFMDSERNRVIRLQLFPRQDSAQA